MIRWGNVLFLLLIIMLFGISWFVKYPDLIFSEALVTTQVPPQKEYAKITGKLNTILVADNEIVKENQALAILENTANYEDVFKLKSVIDTIVVTSKSFYFPIDSLPI
jgi:multidrug efflux pump subunit AcrA (membrane-fusion protein)